MPTNGVYTFRVKQSSLPKVIFCLGLHCTHGSGILVALNIPFQGSALTGG